jgi:hypothetical protein
VAGSGTRTGDLPAYSIVPQPTTLPRPPYVWFIYLFLISLLNDAVGNETVVSVIG